jgi:hypothetical protein
MQSASHPNCRHGKEARTAETDKLDHPQDCRRLSGGEIEALDEAAAIEKAAAEYKVPATRLMATRRR